MNATEHERQQVLELCSATIRALAGDAALQLRGRRLFRGGEPLHAAPAHLQVALEQEDLRSRRGAADGLAWRQRRTDAALHARLAPAEPAARRLFDLLEQYRVEALVPEALAGVRHNLAHRHARWAATFETEGLLETEQGLLVYTVALVCRVRLNGLVLDAHTEDLLEGTRFALAPRLGTAFARLRATRHDQAAFAEPAAEIAIHVAGLLKELEEASSEAREAGAAARQRRLGLWLGEESEESQEVPVAGAASSRVLEEGGGGYRVFTRQYDSERDARTLGRAEVLRSLREGLDAAVAQSGVNVGRLARQLQALFAPLVEDGWNTAQEEGRIDGRLLAQLVASPTERRLFKQPRLQPVADCAVTLLVDCSGSMKQHAATVSLLVDVLARALEQAGVTCEVLGFTTGAWHGGRARRDWQRAGSPRHPGRLNEVCHVVFKPADDTWRRRRAALAALLQPDFYREGVDGEAVAWACARLRARQETRKLLVVVSDGSPMDGSTALANDAHYLDHHLQQVVAAQSAVGDVEIRGLGVGLDLSPYYPRNLVLDLSVPVPRMLQEIAGLLAVRGVR